MPIDGDFGRITCKRNYFETLSFPSDVVRIIQSAQKHKPFNIVYANNNLTDNLCDDGRPVLDVKDYKDALEKALLSPQRANLNLQQSREFLFQPRKPITVNFRDRFQYPKRELMLFRSGYTAENLNDLVSGARSAYDDFLLISEVKH
ncbi:unnamed protein product [Allacma fusca]|uniref:Uncharacterized protein n=1 Tax=Allacma fusca TaxID=39272 RepID=A0A8J2KD96_9HEXA|nr:unnamed protein product [Allacma fusca]